MKKATLIGFLIGIVLIIVLWLTGPYQWDGWVLPFLSKISLPVGYVVSWITGWSFHHEEGILVLVYAAPITIVLVCTLIGIAVGWVQMKKSKRSQPKLEIITKEQRKTSMGPGETSNHVPGSDWGE